MVPKTARFAVVRESVKLSACTAVAECVSSAADNHHNLFRFRSVDDALLSVAGAIVTLTQKQANTIIAKIYNVYPRAPNNIIMNLTRRQYQPNWQNGICNLQDHVEVADE
jgi:hypothetical protein